MLDRLSTLFGGMAFLGGAVAAYTQLGGVALEMRVALLVASTIAALIFTVIWARSGLLNRERADVFASPPTIPPSVWLPRVLPLLAVGTAGMALAFLLLPYHNITISTAKADDGAWLVEFRAPIAPVEVVWISPTPAPRPDCRPNAIGSEQQPRTQMVNWETATASFQVWDFIRDQRVIFECFEAASASSFSVQTQPVAARALTPAVRMRYIQWIVALNVLAVALSIVALWLFTGRARWRFSRRE